MQVKNLQTQKGFTLVEIAIVLVIIGLLLGGVLKGQELINNAKVKSVVSEFENVAAAYYSYQDRKGAYPATTDNDAFWFDLRTEGFVSGAPGASNNSPGPSNSFGGDFQMLVGDGTGLKDGKIYLCATNIDGADGGNIDTKYDDGVNSTGTLRSVTDAATLADTAAEAYTVDTLIALCKEL